MTPGSQRILLIVGGLASIVLGTLFIVFAILNWEFGSVPSDVLAINPVRAITTGGLEDLYYIVLGITLWGLGIDALLTARHMGKIPSKAARPAPKLVPVAAGYGAVAVSISSVRFFDLFDLSLFIFAVVAIWAFVYSYTLWNKSKKQKGLELERRTPQHPQR